MKSAHAAGISESSGKRLIYGHDNAGKEFRIARTQRELPGPVENKELCPEALRALDDFGYFQKRYLGRVAVPWQEMAAERIVELLETPRKEFAVINCPPGVGKSTTFTHDIPLWLTCRNRKIRGLIGSITGKLAVQYLRRLRNTLQSVVPDSADDDEKRKGISLDAETTVSFDYGRFKPMDQDIWTAEGFVVAQIGDSYISEKEPTWTAVGRDQEFLGGRFDICVWDDLVTLKRLRTLELIEADRVWWDSYAERRLEPGGLLILQGQRMGAEDLYRYCRDMPAPIDVSDIDVVDLDIETHPRKYTHIKFKAHYEELCTGDHKDVKPYPDGCLLYPERLPWHELYALKEDKPGMFAQVFQQEDVATSTVLVDPAWVNGSSGHPGCWDRDRDRLEIPKGLTQPIFSYATADPSPTRYWAIEWWIYHQPSGQHFLIDLERRGMDAPDFLDWNQNQGKFTGLMDEWQETSRALGVPITHWIVEINAAQRFLLQYDHVRRWSSQNSVEIVPHSTHRNKTDPQYGVQMMAPEFKFGRVRLPGKASSKGRMVSMRLVDEVTRYPETSTDDCLMAMWFYLFQLQYLAQPQVGKQTERRPHWMGARKRVAA